MYSEAAKKIQEQFEELDVKALTDSQMIKFFQQVDLALPPKENSSGLDILKNVSSENTGVFRDNCKIFNCVADEYQCRASKMIKVNCTNVDEFVNSPLDQLPERFSWLNPRYEFAKSSKIVFTEFNSEVKQIKSNDKLVGVATDNILVIFDGNTSECKATILLSAYGNKLSFGFAENVVTLVFLRQKTAYLSQYDLKEFKAIKFEVKLPFYPEYINCVTDDVIQFYDKNRVGNFILTDTVKTCFFNLNNVECQLPRLDDEDHEFGDLSYFVEESRLMINAVSFEYTLISKAKDICHNDFGKMNQLKNSKTFEKLPQILKNEFIKDVREMSNRVVDNNKFFKY